MGGAARTGEIPTGISSRRVRKCVGVIDLTDDDDRARLLRHHERIAGAKLDVLRRALETLVVETQVYHQPPGYGRSAQRIERPLALLNRRLLQRRFFGSRGVDRGLHNGGLLFDPPNQLLAALLLKLTHVVPLEHGCTRVCRRQQAASALQQRT